MNRLGVYYRYGPWMDTNLVLPLGPRKCIVVFDYFLEASLKVTSWSVYLFTIAYVYSNMIDLSCMNKNRTRVCPGPVTMKLQSSY